MNNNNITINNREEYIKFLSPFYDLSETDVYRICLLLDIIESYPVAIEETGEIIYFIHQTHINEFANKLEISIKTTNNYISSLKKKGVIVKKKPGKFFSKRFVDKNYFTWNVTYKPTNIMGHTYTYD